MSNPLTPEDIEGWYDDNDVFEKRMVLLCAALLPRERRLIEHALEMLPSADYFEVRIGGSPRTEVFSKADVQMMWDLFDNAWVGPEDGTTLPDLVKALVADLVQMDKSTAIELESWPAAKALVKAIRPAWRSTRRRASYTVVGPIYNLDLIVRTNTILHNANINDIGQLVGMTESDLMALKGMTVKQVDGIRKALAEYNGLHLKGES